MTMRDAGSMSELFRPRRRPLLRLALALGAFAILATGATAVIWLRIHVVPPDCEDPETLALVRQSLTGRFGLPASVSIENIETHAGGYVASASRARPICVTSTRTNWRLVPRCPARCTTSAD
jgi:hypothetical protein